MRLLKFKFMRGVLYLYDVCGNGFALAAIGKSLAENAYYLSLYSDKVAGSDIYKFRGITFGSLDEAKKELIAFVEQRGCKILSEELEIFA